ncbi:DNA replication complex GINS protein PSF2 [Geodia barretti]|uniref:DNA replication complex GINS protein PSF2 n=1 Tax=Geodia barretti TaxID=519541 RepID=A0AA35RR48_GEOBA|nr:DNA replication complex GINS protein PSF2 [Geodia barretti]
MEPAEVEFLAEKEQITIVPNFSENKLYLISGEFGPFNPSMQTRVPLWLAINLRQRQKCHIVPPDWLNVDYLTEKKSEEAAESFFTAMPSPNYMEVSSLVLNKSVGTAPSHGSLPPHSCAPLRPSERSDCSRRKFLQRLREI